MNPVQVSGHHAQRNSRECGRDQQLGNKNCERRTQDDRERIQSQIAEMNPTQVAAHRAQRNIRERGRSQQLGNDNNEILTQYKAV